MSSQNLFDLPEDRLASTTETGKRVYLYPAYVQGFFRTARTWVYSLLVVVFLGLPWITINGNPALLLDIAHRQFFIFGLSFWADDAPMLVLVFGSFGLSIAFITSLFGRIWCGWACPQTVFIDVLFRRIERWIEGTAASQRKRDTEPWTLKKITLKSIKWGLFLSVALVISNSFLAYFVGKDHLFQMMQHSPFENPSPALLMAVSTAIILFDFGWFREQFCIIACPYGRMQSVIMDANSLIVGYDQKRGEPRQNGGDCINCYRCVQVCPTGVDIRRGVQLECIMCTACIDACDTVMAKINKPRGLIRYTTLNKLIGQQTSFIRPRSILYFLVLITLLASLAGILYFRPPFEATLIRGQVPYSLSKDGVTNHFHLRLYSHQLTPGALKISLKNNDPQVRLITPLPAKMLEGGEKKTVDLFFLYPKSYLKNGRGALEIEIQVSTKNRPLYKKSLEVPLVGPY